MMLFKKKSKRLWLLAVVTFFTLYVIIMLLVTAGEYNDSLAITRNESLLKMKVALFSIASLIGLIISLIIIFSKSEEEINEYETNYGKDIIKELIKTINKIDGVLDDLHVFGDYSPKSIKYFRDNCLEFLNQLRRCHGYDIKSDAVKVILAGIGNTLIVVYNMLDGYWEKRREIIKSKPTGWEMTVAITDESIDMFIEMKGFLHKSYEDVEKIALRHKVSITRSDDATELKYLVYTNPDTLKLLKKKKK